MSRSEFLPAESLPCSPTPGGLPVPRATVAASAGDGSRRIDPPHGRVAGPPHTASINAAAPASLAANLAVAPIALLAEESDEAEMAARESLLKLHAADLIERLQVWSSDLDARESQINSRAAWQDHRERQFRLWSQSRRADLEESVRAAEERAEELRQAARRLMITELGQRTR